MEAIPERKEPGKEEFAWLVDKAILVSTATALGEDAYAIRELDDFLSLFAHRQEDKIRAGKEVRGN